MEDADKEKVNVASLVRLCASDNEKPLTLLSERMREDSIASMNYRGAFVAVDNTKRSIYVSLNSMLRIFNTQKKLMKMLSGNTIDMRSIGREKTAVYVIVPDEKTKYYFWVTTFIKQVYEVLIMVLNPSFYEKGYDIFSRLLKDRIILMFNEVNDDLACSIIA